MSLHSERVDSFLSKRDYRGADLDIVRRITAAAAFLTAFLTAALSPLALSDSPLGEAAWPVLVVLVGGGVLVGLRLVHTEELQPNMALAIHYSGLCAVASFVWLTGGTASPYATLFLIWMALAGASHPPRRTFGIIAVAALLALLPLAYDNWSGVFLGETILRLLIWSALTVMACVWTTQVRMQRANLTEDGEEARRQARADALTGLGNRRAFDERLEREIARARATGTPLSVIVSDLDGFKQINDSWGHVNGDEVLRAAAAAMRAAVRDHDSCYRWGGDEFAVLLPRVHQETAERVAERVSASVVATCTRPDGEPQTLAWGTAELTPEMQASDLLASADLALMTRKHQRGRPTRFRAEAPDPETS